MRVWNSLSVTARNLVIAIGAIFLIALAAGLLIIFFIFRFEGPLQYAAGLAAGCALSVIKVALLDRSLHHVADMEGKNASAYAAGQFALRYGITMVVLALVVFFRNVFGLFGTIIGILSLQLSAYAVSYFCKDQLP